MQRTKTTTYLTVPDGQSQQLFAAEFWCRVKLFLETAGPVAIGLDADISPVLSGRGILLPSGGPEIELEMQKGDRLYVVAEAINRVKFTLVPEFLQQATETIDQTTLAVIPGIVEGFRGIVSSVLGSRFKRPEPPQAICPPPIKPPRF